MAKCRDQGQNKAQESFFWFPHQLGPGRFLTVGALARAPLAASTPCFGLLCALVFLASTYRRGLPLSCS